MRVWAEFHRAALGAGDVAVPEARKADPAAWKDAIQRALANGRFCEGQAVRWYEVADELADKAPDDE